MKTILKALTFLIIWAILLGGGYVVYEAHDFLHTPASDTPQDVVFSIKQGATFDRIAWDLKKAGIITDVSRFRLLAMYHDVVGKMKAGDFMLSTGWTPDKVLYQLTQGQAMLYKLAIREGLTWWETAKAVEEQGFARYEDFKEVIHDPVFLRRHNIPFANAEGFLYPETYMLKKPRSPLDKAQAREVAEIMVRTFWKKTEPIWKQLPLRPELLNDAMTYPGAPLLPAQPGAMQSAPATSSPSLEPVSGAASSREDTYPDSAMGGTTAAGDTVAVNEAASARGASAEDLRTPEANPSAAPGNSPLTQNAEAEASPNFSATLEAGSSPVNTGSALPDALQQSVLENPPPASVVPPAEQQWTSTLPPPSQENPPASDDKQEFPEPNASGMSADYPNGGGPNAAEPNAGQFSENNAATAENLPPAASTGAQETANPLPSGPASAERATAPLADDNPPRQADGSIPPRANDSAAPQPGANSTMAATPLLTGPQTPEDIDPKILRRLIILASLVEKETGVPSERQRVAGVYTNRLRLRMLLQCDPTIIYGVGPSFSGAIRRSQLDDAKNLYNTYQHAGLPPGPICSSGFAALEAAFAPEQHDFLYFVATGIDGGHTFSKNLAEHNRAVQIYRERMRSNKNQ